MIISQLTPLVRFALQPNARPSHCTTKSTLPCGEPVPIVTNVYSMLHLSAPYSLSPTRTPHPNLVHTSFAHTWEHTGRFVSCSNIPALCSMGTYEYAVRGCGTEGRRVHRAALPVAVPGGCAHNAHRARHQGRCAGHLRLVVIGGGGAHLCVVVMEGRGGQMEANVLRVRMKHLPDRQKHPSSSQQHYEDHTVMDSQPA